MKTGYFNSAPASGTNGGGVASQTLLLASLWKWPVEEAGLPAGCKPVWGCVRARPIRFDSEAGLDEKKNPESRIQESEGKKIPKAVLRRIILDSDSWILPFML